MAIGRRCGMGCTGAESWPDTLLYKKCPVCGEETTRFRNVSPMDPDEAQSILLHEQFERFYQRWCVRRGYESEGPLPEEPQQLPRTTAVRSRRGGGGSAGAASA